jgi:hypothetical protein
VFPLRGENPGGESSGRSPVAHVPEGTPLRSERDGEARTYESVRMHFLSLVVLQVSVQEEQLILHGYLCGHPGMQLNLKKNRPGTVIPEENAWWDYDAHRLELKR